VSVIENEHLAERKKCHSTFCANLYLPVMFPLVQVLTYTVKVRRKKTRAQMGQDCKCRFNDTVDNRQKSNLRGSS